MLFLFFSLILSQEYRLANKYLTYIWTVNENNYISTKLIENHFTDTSRIIIPTEGSEEFIISLKENPLKTFEKNSVSNYFIKSSNLQIQNIQSTDTKIVINFNPYILNDATWNVKEIVELQPTKHYLHKSIQIKSSNKDVFIDYIDLNSLVFSDEDLQYSWSAPKSDNPIQYLGQPVYINSIFFACTFPLAQSIIEPDQKLARTRYYAGKKFSDLTLNIDGYYETWKIVFGVSSSNQIPVVRNDFFSYISDISVSSPFRKQSSEINTKKAAQTFKDIEKGCSQYGLPPLDSIVTKNKFSMAKYALKINSNSGLEFTPRKVKADIKEESKQYIENIKQQLISYIHKYKSNYLKIEEFNELNSIDDLYQITDLWEHVITAYREMIAASKEEGIENFWISTPVHSNLSPFHLQWSNSILNEIPTDNEQNQDLDQILTFCDQHYWLLFEKLQFQFPSKSLQATEKVNFDKKADDESFRSFLFGHAMRGSSFNEIKELSNEKWFINSDIFSWFEANFNVLQNSQRFGGEPLKGDVYGYSAWHGHDGVISFRNPGNEARKFSLKIDDKIGLRKESVTFYRSTTLHYRTTNTNEIKNGAAFRYGDTIEVTLQPGEHRIYEFHDHIDHSPPTVEVIKSARENEVFIRFDKHVDLDNAQFKIDGLQIKEIKLHGDFRTVTLKTSIMKNYSVYKVNIEKVKNTFGDALKNSNVEFQYFANNEIVSIIGELTGNDNIIQLTDVKTDSFTINLHVKDFNGLSAGTLLHSEDGNVIVELDENGHIRFSVGSVSVVSNLKVKNSVDYQFSFVRERNTMLKIYINTELDNSKYLKEMPKIVNLKKMKLNKNPVLYSSIRIDNYGLPYNEVPYEISLKNNFIEQIFSIENRKVRTRQIINHRTDQAESFTPASGGEEFTFAIPSAENKAQKSVTPKNDQENMKIVKSSECEFDFEYRINSANEETILFIYHYFYNRVHFNITKRYDLHPDSTYIEKQIIIKCSNDKQLFYYIDLDSFTLSESDAQKSWSHPTLDQDKYTNMSPFILNLGQPIYINSFYTGCLFPLSDNAIENRVSHLRYHTGKTFGQLLNDNPINNDQDIDAYYCWKTVFGAARSSRIEVIRSDLFDYISSISVPTKFRKQFNSWYDWMLNIDETNILESFKEIENGLSSFGVPPLDSYVVDDGWNNYNTQKYDVFNEHYSGSTYNQNGFWEFNSKFPNGLSKPSELTDRLASHFGVWLGPRGGYVTPGQFGKVIEDSKSGFFNAQSNDVDVGSMKYIKRLDAFLADWISQYRVNYLKLDGFAMKACENKSHDHIVGGDSGVYYYTDFWERYIRVFGHFRDVAEVKEIRDFWISITSFVNPSPFHLQWSNSVWIQVSEDIGFVKVCPDDSYADQMLNYRDGCYYDFFNVYQFQFPQRSLYNHDPIYGKSETPLQGSLSNDAFRMFLYFCACRGNAFTEMYYTFSMLGEGDKWYINSEVLKWAESRFDVLQHSRRFGGDPRKGDVYGYSAWNDKSGTIAIRNPSNKTVSYAVRINESFGVPSGVMRTYRKTVISHKSEKKFVEEGSEVNYNDEIVFKLRPHEARVVDFIENKDELAPSVELCRAISKQRVLVRFNKRIVKVNENFKIADLQILNVSIKADKRTVIIRTSPMQKDKSYELELNGISDQFGNQLNEDIEFTYRPHGIFTISDSFRLARSQTNDEVLSDEDFQTDSFSIQLEIASRNEQNCVLIDDSEKSFSVEIVDRKVKFSVGQLSVFSREELPTTNSKVKVVRERNGMIKIYINGELSNSAYNSSSPENDASVSIHTVTLKQAPVTYSNVVASNYAFKYNEDANESENDDDNSPVDPDDDLLDEECEEGGGDEVTSGATDSSSSGEISAVTESSDGDNENKDKGEKDNSNLSFYIAIIFFVLSVIVLAVIILLIVFNFRSKEPKKSQIAYPLMSENL